VANILCCLIDKQGNQLAKPVQMLVGDYSDGMLAAGGGYLNVETWEMIKSQNLSSVYDTPAYSEGLVNTSDGRYMDKDGKDANLGTFAVAGPFSEGLAPVVPDDGKNLWGYIDKTGRMAIEPQYLSAYGFGEGLACVETAEHKWVFIDKSGKEAFSLQEPVGRVKSFSEGLCAVGKLKEKLAGYNFTDEQYDWGFIDKTGKLVVDCKYHLVSPFRNGIAAVWLSGHGIGYIDKTGKYIWKPK
jgi:hypothetical protein